jgi:prolipoprotein diacylglyceryltransferase
VAAAMSRVMPSYRTCVLGGSAAGIAVAAIFSVSPLLWVAVAAFAVCVALFLAAMTKVLFGVESFSFLHYQLATIAATALMYAPALDSLALALAIAQAIGRIGCASAGCCYGHVGRVRVQLVESAALFVIAAFTVKFGIVFYAVAYAITRFTLEFFREDRRRRWLGASEAQWICLITTLALALGGHA